MLDFGSPASLPVPARRRVVAKVFGVVARAGWFASASLLFLACQQEEEPSSAGDSADAAGSATGGTGSAVLVEDVDQSTSGLVFSHTRGVYGDPFDLTVTNPTGAQVAYTLDCTDPRTSASAITGNSPLSIHVDPADTSNRFRAPGFIVRAVSLDGTAQPPSAISTHTYLFLDRTVELSPDGQSPGGAWPQPVTGGSNPWGGGESEQVIDYGMDPDVCDDPAYRDQIIPALRAIPSMSLCLDPSHLFDPDTGIYVNALEQGPDWGRPGSIELLNPDGTPGFQAGTGVRIRGGYSRIGDNPKHAFRLFFRGEYGATKLHFPLFQGEGVDAFDKVDLRTSQNYSWSFYADPKNTMNRDVFSRDLQRALSRPYTRSRYYHLFLDGVYWGLFQSQERSEARFAASYFGGDNDDYDTIKVERELNDIAGAVATDGTLDAWHDLYARCQTGFAADADYYALEGRGPDGQRDPALPVLVDLDNLIDYMLVIFYTGNFDAPVSAFFDNETPNNFYAVNNRVNPDQGFLFFAHDSEHTLIIDETPPGIGLYEDRVNIGTTNTGNGIMRLSSATYFHPQWLHFRLSDNANYRTRFAARAQQVLEGSAPMTPSAATAMFQARAAEIDLAIIAESARWGDAKTARPMTKNDHWVPMVNRIVDEFFPARTRIVIDQLRTAGLYPN